MPIQYTLIKEEQLYEALPSQQMALAASER